MGKTPSIMTNLFQGEIQDRMILSQLILVLNDSIFNLIYFRNFFGSFVSHFPFHRLQDDLNCIIWPLNPIQVVFL
jgi:hypothetical protein